MFKTVPELRSSCWIPSYQELLALNLVNNFHEYLAQNTETISHHAIDTHLLVQWPPYPQPSGSNCDWEQHTLGLTSLPER
jgi:hypothetical protein